MMTNDSPHISVMLDEVVSHFADQSIGIFFDGTLGAGGHARAILEKHPEIRTYIGCDRDPEALAIAARNLSPWKDKIELIHGDFSQLDRYLEERRIKTVDGFFLISGCRLCN